MMHYKRVLEVPLMTVRYEALVADPQPHIRELVRFCGLRWRRSCLEFHQMQRDVSTASYEQVRQPSYTSSVGRSKHYERHRGSLKEALGRLRVQQSDGNR